MAKRDTIRYQVKKPGGEIAHRGITQRPLEERFDEHKKEYGEDISIMKIGPKVTKETALDWERRGGKRV